MPQDPRKPPAPTSIAPLDREALAGYQGPSREAVERDLLAALRPSTLRGYRADWRGWEAWCARRQLDPCQAPGEAIYAYLSHLADLGKSRSTVDRAKASISTMRELTGHARPSFDGRIALLMRGVRRRLPARQRRKAALLPTQLAEACRQLPGTLHGLRDRALLLVGFAGAFRRSELVDIDIEHCAFEEHGMIVLVPRSKTDVEGRGATVAIPYSGDERVCPVEAVRAWTEAAQLASGPLFRRLTPDGRLDEGRASSAVVSRAVKRAAALCGLDPALYGGHSLRAGFATAAARARKPLESIMRHGRWTSVEMALRYVRDATPFEDNAADGLLGGDDVVSE